MADVTRRDFLVLTEGALVAAGLAVVAVPAVAYFYPPDLRETPAEPVSAGPASDLPVGQSTTVPYGRYPAIVINTTEGLRAYSAVCTHFACLVKWDSARGELVCPCHDAAFDPLDGHVTGGPPPRGLDTFPVNVVNGEIFVGGAEEGATA
jgi:cytochrome b6-f complex iron-sulfur subunit